MAYIDREAVLKQIHIERNQAFLGKIAANKLEKYINNTPTANVEEVKHGHWIEDGEYQICSVCGEEHHWDEYRATYCEDCGAKMDGGKANGR